MDAHELKRMLAFHYGSETVFKHALVSNVTYTEGVRTFAQNAGGGAYWLLDILATEPAIRAQAKEFALITLNSTGENAILTVTDGNNGAPVYRRVIDYTDCPEGSWMFYMIGTMIMLPSEY